MKKIVCLCCLCMLLQISAGYALDLNLAGSIQLQLCGELMSVNDNEWASIELLADETLQHINQIHTNKGEEIQYSFRYFSEGGEKLRVVAGKSVYQTLLPQSTSDILIDVGMLYEISMQGETFAIKAKKRDEAATFAKILLLNACDENGKYSDDNVLYQATVDTSGTIIEHTFTVPENINQGIIMISCGNEQSILYDVKLTENYTWTTEHDVVNTDLGISEVVTPFSVNSSTRQIFEKAKRELPTESNVIKARSYNCGTKVYVATNGSDLADGSLASPFKTLNKAVEAANMLSEEEKNGGVAIYLRGGEYSVQQAVRIRNYKSNNKAPLYISAYNDEKVEIYAGKKLNPSTFSQLRDESMRSRLLSDDAQKKVLEISLSDFGLTNIPDLKYISLYVNEKQMSLARYPNVEELEVKNVVDSGVDSDGTKRNEFKLRFTEENPNLWSHDNDIRAYGSFTNEWQKKNIQVEILDNNIMHGFSQSLDEVRGGNDVLWPNRYFYYNVFEELDMPGEWYIDRTTGTLYLYPPENFDSADIRISTCLDNIIRIEGSENVVVDGLEVGYTEVAAIGLTNCKNCIIQRCNIRAVSSGVNMSDCVNSGVIENDMYEIGDYRRAESHAVYVTTVWEIRESTLDSFTLNRNFVQNNVIVGGAVSMEPIKVEMNNGCVVSHNYIANSAASGIVLNAGFDNIVEYNEICGGPNTVMDAGGIYLHGNIMSKAHNHIRYNYIHDFSTRQYQRSNAVYFDNLSSFSFAYGNIIKNCPNGFYSNGGRDNVIYNNIFYSDKALVQNGLGCGKAIWNTSYFSETTGGLWDNISIAKIDRWLSRFDDSENEYNDRYPELYKYLNNAKQILIDKSNGAGITDLERETAIPGGMYIDKNFIIGNGYTMSCVGNTDSFEIGTNRIVNLADYNMNVFSEIENFEMLNYSRMGITETRTPQTTLKLLGSKRDGNEIVVEWYPVFGANYYIVEIYGDKNFLNVIETAESDYSYYKVKTQLEEGQELYCRVTAKCNAKSNENFIPVEASWCLNNGVVIDAVNLSDSAVNFSAVNKYDTDKMINVIITESDIKGNLLCSEIEPAQTLKPYTSAPFAYTFRDKNTECIKIFIWENMGSMKPLTGLKEMWITK